MTYSAVIHPPGRVSGNHGGNSRATDAVQSTTVLPCSQSTDPAGTSVNRRVIFTGRNWSLALPSLRMGHDYNGGPAESSSSGEANCLSRYSGGGQGWGLACSIAKPALEIKN